MAATPGAISPTNDDALTICAISLLSGMVADVLHEGLGHGALALITGTQSGVLTTVAWSSAFDSKLVAAGGTLANLAAGIVFWIALRSAKRASVQLRYFFLTSAAFNLLAGTGYFFFSGVTNFGDWAVVIADWPAHWLWRTLLVVVGIAADYVAGFVVGNGAREVRWRSASRTAKAAKAYANPLLLGGTPLSGGRTLEPDWDSVGLAIRTAGSGRRTQRAAVVAILHSKKDRSRARIGRRRQELRLDHRGCNPVTRFHFRVGTRDHVASLEGISSERLFHQGDHANSGEVQFSAEYPSSGTIRVPEAPVRNTSGAAAGRRGTEFAPPSTKTSGWRKNLYRHRLASFKGRMQTKFKIAHWGPSV